MTPLARRIAAPALVAAAALLARGLWWEPRRLVVRRDALALPAWPASLTGVRVGVIADLHAGGPHVDESRVERVVAVMNREAPDLVVLLGDFADPEVKLGAPVAPEAVARRLGRLRARLGVLAVLGNHDWEHGGERMAAALRSEGVRVLEDDAAGVGDRGRTLWVAGVGDLRARGADVPGALAGVPEGEPALLLSHDPDVFPRVPPRVALTISGHTHGGQVDLPLVRRRVIPSRYGDRYAAGHVEEDGRHLYVSRGVGTANLPVRFRSPPEIAVLELRGASPSARPGRRDVAPGVEE
jgi:predicted MPP superfamily phosphohydrolase